MLKNKTLFRLHEFRLNSYSIASEDTTERRASQEEGCTLIPTEPDTTQMDLASIGVKKAVDVSQQLINFSMNVSQIDMLAEKSATEHVPSNNAVEPADDLMKFDMTVPIENDNVEFEDEELFEKSISCPPPELQDDLFDSSFTDENQDEQTESLASLNALAPPIQSEFPFYLLLIDKFHQNSKLFPHSLN